MKNIILLIPLLAVTCMSSAININETETARPAAASPSPSSTPGAAVCTVTADQSLNLRRAPGIDAEIIAWLGAGEVVTILPGEPSGQWVKVRAGNLFGWINSNYCK